MLTKISGGDIVDPVNGRLGAGDLWIRDGEIVEALSEHRVRIQSAVGRQVRAKKTPILDFRPDIAIRSAERIDGILREDRRRRGELPADDDVASDAPAGNSDAASEDD